ncbi:MAG: helix-hairpin-helix domain-containing protein [Eggerthellaceae bacterium]
MPFIQVPEKLKEKARLDKLSLPLLVGLAALVLVVLVFTAGSALSALGDDSFQITKGGSETLEGDQQGEGSSASDESKDEGANGVSRNKADDPSTGEDQSKSGQGENAKLVVYVCGQVTQPGVYEFAPGSRIGDAIERAGGFGPEAATDALNLAQSLQDEQQVYVPAKDELPASGGTVQSGPEIPANDSGAGQSSALVNINTASAAELVSLPGVGDATAAKIVASRESEGPFQTIEDLKRVSGIGDKKFDSLKDLICV